MDNALRHDIALSRRQVDGLVFKVNDEMSVEDEEKLIIVVVLVPVVFPLHDAKADDRIVHFAERLVVPAVRAGGYERKQRRHAQHRESNVEIRRIGSTAAVQSSCPSMSKVVELLPAQSTKATSSRG